MIFVCAAYAFCKYRKMRKINFLKNYKKSVISKIKVFGVFSSRQDSFVITCTSIRQKLQSKRLFYLKSHFLHLTQNSCSDRKLFQSTAYLKFINMHLLGKNAYQYHVSA